jgi:hypothetical protein
MAWPGGPLGDVFEFLAPSGGPYYVIVAKYVLVNGEWVPTRGCATVLIPPLVGPLQKGV